MKHRIALAVCAASISLASTALAATHHPFTLAAAHQVVSAYERHYGGGILWSDERVGACQWRHPAVAACEMRFHGQIFKPEPGIRVSPVTFTWFDRVREVNGRLTATVIKPSVR